MPLAVRVKTGSSCQLPWPWPWLATWNGLPGNLNWQADSDSQPAAAADSQLKYFQSGLHRLRGPGPAWGPGYRVVILSGLVPVKTGPGPWPPWRRRRPSPGPRRRPRRPGGQALAGTSIHFGPRTSLVFGSQRRMGGMHSIAAPQPICFSINLNVRWQSSCSERVPREKQNNLRGLHRHYETQVDSKLVLASASSIRLDMGYSGSALAILKLFDNQQSFNVL